MSAVKEALAATTAQFRAAGFRWAVTPALARAVRRHGLWDEAVHIEQKPIPIRHARSFQSQA